MSDVVLVAIVSGVVSAAVNWGIVRVQLAWLRRDVDDLRKRMSAIERGSTAA